MPVDNSVPRFTDAPKNQLQDAQGITQFPTVNSWNHTVSGLIFQGGKITAAGEIKFSIPYRKQLLYISAAQFSGESARGFSTTATSGYWLAIGV